ncbi:hypothetical protein ACEUDE_12105 [Aeromonas veronii]
MDQSDLTPRSKERIRSIVEQSDLELSTIRENKTIEPTQQIDFARALNKNYELWINNLLWKGYPNYDQLKFICSLIWEFFEGAKLGNRSVVSASQLSFKIRELSINKPIWQLIQESQGYRPNEKIDVIISRILDFRRLWANFHFPRLLRAIESIVNNVQKIRGAKYLCDYSAYSIMIENYFLDPSIVALEEYGLPLEVSLKFRSILSSEGDLDKSLAALKNLQYTNQLSSVEVNFLARAKEGI